MNTFTPCLDTLPPAQKALWPRLAPCAAAGLVLYGGTAIALRLGHRQSVDFDFFTHHGLEKGALRTALPFLATATTLQDSQNTLTVTTQVEDAPVKISFFGGFDCGRIGTPEMTTDKVLAVASLPDLFAHKLKAILQRSAAKDYQDIAALLRHGLSLAEGLAAARLMWPTFQPATGLKALAFFGDGDLKSLSDEDKERLTTEASKVGNLPDVERLSDTLD